MHFEGLAKGDQDGFDIRVNCPCGQYLTTLKVNNFSIINAKIECKRCGITTELQNLHADDPIRIKREDIKK